MACPFGCSRCSFNRTSCRLLRRTLVSLTGLAQISASAVADENTLRQLTTK